MQHPDNSNRSHPFGKVFILYQIATFGLVAVLCWLGRALTLEAYSSGLIIAGIVLLTVDIAGTVGNWNITRDFVYLYSFTASAKRLNDQVARDLREHQIRYGVLFEEALVGLFPILVGVILKLGAL
jgi:hypothetical protein